MTGGEKVEGGWREEVRQGRGAGGCGREEVGGCGREEVPDKGCRSGLGACALRSRWAAGKR